MCREELYKEGVACDEVVNIYAYIYIYIYIYIYACETMYMLYLEALDIMPRWTSSINSQFVATSDGAKRILSSSEKNVF
jgi:hypothetical protein